MPIVPLEHVVCGGKSPLIPTPENKEDDSSLGNPLPTYRSSEALSELPIYEPQQPAFSLIFPLPGSPAPN